MAGLTLTLARKQVLRHLDAIDSAGNVSHRFVPSGSDYTDVDRAILVQVKAILRRLADAGDYRLLKVVSANTASTGILDVSSYDPVDIVGVAMVDGTYVRKLSMVSLLDRGQPHTGVSSLKVALMQAWAPDSGDASANIFQFGGTDAPTDECYDELACLKAARTLSARDGDRLAALEGVIADLERTVFKEPGVSAARFPRRRERHTSWYYDPTDRTIGLVWDVP